MRMEKGTKLFVRIDYAVEGKIMADLDIQEHLTYVKSIAGERYFIGGGFSNINGGMCLFDAQNIEDAQRVAQNDPIIKKGFYRYEIYEWELMVLSEDTINQ